MGLYAGTAVNFLTDSFVTHAEGKHPYDLAFDLIGQRGLMFLHPLRFKRAVAIPIRGQFKSACGCYDCFWGRAVFTIGFKVLSQMGVKFSGQSSFRQRLD
ncbi:hypothetical protein SSYM_2523 [Serratia symbiotica str. Tucson]|uniref:Uncharacterized protein n=1 Tax=Serratia symbiotica str. Tucson TaxID=914128 RepID=E9CPP9_9GAMM|nr:hypothetical protein SSYM_2523 [Serratia symbiotica str. Tucson]